MPEPELQSTALRYAASDLTAAEAAAFEERLAADQDARDALAEAVRLSAAALGQTAPRPGSAFRARLRERLNWTASRGLAWAAGGAGAVAACTLVALSLADRTQQSPAAAPVAPAVVLAEASGPGAEPDAPAAPREATEPVAAEHPGACGDDRSVAEIWADLSSHEHVEKARDDEARWRQKMNSLAHPHHVPSAARSDAP